MTTLGVFRDDFYNPISILPMLQSTTTSQASGTLVASNLAGASEVYIKTSGATALTTDTGANIVNQIISAIVSANNGASVPNLTNVTYTLYVRNTNAGTLTLTAGTGVTITGTATVATGVERQYMVQVTGPSSVTITDLGGAAVT